MIRKPIGEEVESQKKKREEVLAPVQVVVKLNSGVDYRGILACLDGYLNIALEQIEEYHQVPSFHYLFCYLSNSLTTILCGQGALKNKYGDAVIRGNNVLYISTQKNR